jgi:AraC family transcriptional regulator
MSPSQPPRAEYARRMHRVLRHIEAHLSEPLVLSELAEVAHFSPFHFHRMFTAWMGETLGEYLRRRRLEIAALRLLTQPQTSVLEIALIVGFGSNEAFAHAFKQRFGCSASQWRRQKAAERALQLRNLNQALGNPDQAQIATGADYGDSHPPSMESPMSTVALNVSVVQLPPQRVAYLRYVGPYGPGVHTFWQQRFYPFLAAQGLLGRPIYGVSHDDPDICAPEKCRYDTCVAVDEAFVASGDAQITTLPGGKYASLPFEGSSAQIGPAWKSLMRDWLPGSGFQLDGRPTFEYYPPNARYDEATGSFQCEIVIPLAPL